MLANWRLAVLVSISAVLGCAAVQAQEEPIALASAGPGRPQNIGAYPGHEYHPTKKWVAMLHCKPMSYALQHWACYHPSHAPYAIALEGQIGMTAPNSANWYSNGFFNFSLDNTSGRNYPIKAVRALDSGGRQASCEFVWELPQAWVRVRFLVIAGHWPLFCSIRQFPKTDKVPTLKVTLYCYPSGYFHDGMRAVTTAKRTIRAVNKVQLDPAQEWWAVFYDENYDLGVNNGVGGCAAIALPDTIATSSLEVTHYPCIWRLTAKPGAKEMRFAFWDGLDKKNAELMAAVKPQLQRELQTLRDADFSPLRLRQAALDALRSEFNRYAAQTPGVDAEKRQFNALVSKLAELRQRMTGVVDIAAEKEYLSTMDKLEELVWQVKMKWIFAD